MPDSSVVLPAGELTEFVRAICEAACIPPERARLVAECLVEANLRGVDTHGIQLLPYYIEQLLHGDMDPKSSGRVVSENGCCLVYDGENGVGQVISEICCGHAVRLARQYGIGMVTAREANHFGATACWGKRISREGMIGIVMCTASPQVPPWQGKETRFGTNPICVSVPGSDTWLLDMATTTVAQGKILKAFINNEPSIPAGWAMDAEGVPTTDPAVAMKGLLMPLGGYKGSGLAFMVEVLCAVLSGGAIDGRGGIRLRGTRTRVSYMFLAIDVARFMPVEEFDAQMQHLVRHVKSAAPASGYSEVLVAGEPEWRTEAIRRETGIPIQSGTWAKLVSAAESVGVPPPDAPRATPS